MKSLELKISDLEYIELGLDKNTVSFSELYAIIRKKLTKQALERSQELAKKYGLSQLSMDEINDEIKTHRDAQNNS